jgi:hypothetical protein
MTAAIEKSAFPAASRTKTDTLQHSFFDVSCPRSVWAGSRSRPGSDDEITFRRWRSRFFLFYGTVIALLLGGIVVFANRPGSSTLTAAAAPASPAIASADIMKRPR